MKHKKILILCVILCLAATALAQLEADKPVERARNITACILKQVDTIGPYVALALALVGGITYVSSLDDTQQRLMGKKFVMFGIIGLILIKALVGIAATSPFNISPSDCKSLGGGTGPTGPSSGSSHLTAPAKGATILSNT